MVSYGLGIIAFNLCAFNFYFIIQEIFYWPDTALTKGVAE